MIAVSFQLTTAQTEMLLSIAYQNWIGETCLPEYKRASPACDFVAVARRLIEKGLVSHHQDAPAYRATPSGRALADMIVDRCEWAVKLRKSETKRVKSWAPVIEAENKRRSAYAARRAAGVDQ